MLVRELSTETWPLGTACRFRAVCRLGVVIVLNYRIDMNFVIKVADFGLAESLDTSKEYFRQDKDNAIKLPIKWLAPESIHDGVFSERSDVVNYPVLIFVVLLTIHFVQWSFGVTCWEVFSGGKTPYPGIHPADLPPQLDKGLRLEKPLNAACTDKMYVSNEWLIFDL